MAVVSDAAATGLAVSVLHLLLVEDSASDALLVRALLQETGEPLHVTTAQSLEAARLELIGSDEFDCVLLDLGLPDADGLEALTGVQAVAPNLAVVVLTGRRDDATGLAAVGAGAQDYLVKGDVTGPLLIRSLRFAYERKASARQLATQARLLDAVGQAVIATDPAGAITYWNRAAEQMYGWSAVEVWGRHVVEVTAGETSVDQAAEILVALAAGRAWSGELWVKRRDGSRFLALVTDTPVRADDGSVVGVIGVSSDVTEQAEGHAAVRRSEERYRQIVETALEGIWVIDTEARTTFVNRRMADILGVGAADMQGRQVAAFLDEAAQVEVRTRLEHRRAGIAERYELPILRSDGARRHVLVAASPLYDDDGTYVGSLGMVTDITDRYEAAAALRDSERQLAEAQHMARVGSWELDLPSGTMSWSDEHCALLGYGWDEVTPGIEEFLVRVHVADRAQARLAFAGLSNGSGRADFEVRLVLPAGEERWLQVRAEPVQRPGGAPVRIRGTSQDVTERKRHEEELSRLALYDALTGLPNRTLLADRLVTAQERTGRGAGVVGVLFIDLDRFKLVNDSRGHSTGDALLQEVARRLRAAVRPADTVGRFGGDEFVIVCEGLRDEGEAEALADRVTEGLAPAIHVGGLELLVTASIGIAVGRGVEAADVLLSAADAAMYRAKGQGRGHRAIFDQSLVERAEHRLVMENDLRSALDKGELRVLYQPVISLSSGRIVGVEALVRWHHPVRGLVSPAEFIPVAEEIGAIERIGGWVLLEACVELAALHRCDPALSMSVNVSARQLARPGFPGVVAQAIGRAQIPPGRLVLEVTESVLMEDAEVFDAGLSTLQAVGVRLAMDDFGTGFSSLSYLQRFPLDIVKIDRAFIRGVAMSASDGALVRGMVPMIRALGMEVVAEGVESADQLAVLRELGCDMAQGFLFARPLTAKDLAGLLASGASW